MIETSAPAGWDVTRSAPTNDGTAATGRAAAGGVATLRDRGVAATGGTLTLEFSDARCGTEAVAASVPDATRLTGAIAADVACLLTVLPTSTRDIVDTSRLADGAGRATYASTARPSIARAASAIVPRPRTVDCKGTAASNRKGTAAIDRKGIAAMTLRMGKRCPQNRAQACARWKTPLAAAAMKSVDRRSAWTVP